MNTLSQNYLPEGVWYNNITYDFTPTTMNIALTIFGALTLIVAIPYLANYYSYVVDYYKRIQIRSFTKDLMLGLFKYQVFKDNNGNEYVGRDARVKSVRRDGDYLIYIHADFNEEFEVTVSCETWPEGEGMGAKFIIIGQSELQLSHNTIEEECS